VRRSVLIVVVIVWGIVLQKRKRPPQRPWVARWVVVAL